MVRGIPGFLALASAGVLMAQSGRSYSADHTWWSAGDGGILPWEEAYDNPDGQTSIWNRNGAVHTAGHPFFERLGSNGRACVTCHQPSNAMSLAAASLRERWKETQGQDPVFAAIDGANCPDLAPNAEASHSLLLERGLFRISLPWPPRTAAGDAIHADFRIEVVRDPTGCNTSPIYGLNSATPTISVYRRPRVAANFGSSRVVLMADGREPSLASQAITAALVHEQAAAQPSASQLREIVAFETRIYAAQSADIRGGRLDERGGPTALGPQNAAAVRVNPSFDMWRKAKGSAEAGLQREFRASVARGSDVFFKKTFRIGMTTGTCATCHQAGGRRWVDAGTANVLETEASPQLPLFRITCGESGHTFYTQDPGRGLITGKCEDVGAILAQPLRGLAARAPYFSNGSARTLREAVEFHERKLHMGYTAGQTQDLLNFLIVL